MCCLIFFIIAVPAVYIFEKQIREDIYQSHLIQLQRELDTKVLAIEKHFQDSVIETRFLNVTPPILGITRANQNNQIDPLLNTHVEIWRDRLSSIFSGFMQTDKSITQARYITLADGGHEFVRVDRFLNKVVRIEDDKLQMKGQRDYVLKASMLDENQVYISPINYNRENGVIQQPFVSTYRVAKPVFNDKRQVFAILVLNYDAEPLFKSLTFSSPKYVQHYLLNSHGEYLYHPQKEFRFGFEFNDSKKWILDFNKNQNMSVNNTLAFHDLPDSFYLKSKIEFNNDIAMLPLELAVSVNTDILLAEISKRRTNFALLLLVFFTVFIFVTLMYQRYINRKLLISSLKEQNSKVIEDSLDAIFTLNVQGNIVQFNQTAKQIFGNKLNDTSLQFESMFSLDDIDTSCIKETLEKGSKMPFEAIYIDGYGNKQFFSITLTRIFDVYNSCYQVAAILRNISSLKHTQSQLESLNSTLELKVSQRTIELERAIDQALAASQAKSDFVANISHEIRTPMNGVLGMLEMLKEDSLTEQQHHYLKLANSSANSLMSLINDILDFSKIEAGKLDIDNHTFDVITVCSDMINSLALQGQRKGLEVFLNTQNVVDRLVIGDSHRLKQILINLLNNAFKFTHKGEVSLTLDTKYITESKLLMSFTIQDSGIGIDSENIDKLFDVFTQEDSSTTRHFGGTGLGLSICKKLAQLMGGNITVQSRKGEGSTFIASVELHVAAQKKLNQAIQLANEIDVAALIARDNVFNNVCQLLEQTCNVKNDKIVRLDYYSEHSAFDADLLVLDDEHPQLDDLIKYCEQQNKKYVLILRDLVSTKQSKKMYPDYVNILNKPLTQDEFSYKLANIFGMCGEYIVQPTKMSQQSKAQINLSNYRVLLVDDNMINIEVAKAILKSTNIAITTASDGVEALDELNSNQAQAFDLILMDCQMPNLDGYDTTTAIRNAKAGSDYIHIPIIAMTASAMQGDRERCLAAGMNDYITKPIKPDTLKNKLVTWLN
ncbi:response regulator [Pseudoalteromonas sp. MMG010]|nr:response regulator [Pseudoalteromonas sp. MMG010]